MLTFNGWLLLLTAFLYALVFKEIVSIPSARDTLTNIFDRSFNTISTYMLITTVYIIVPIIAVTTILAMLKKQMYTENKCIKKSYFTVVSILITTYLLRAFKSIFVFYTKLAISDSFYVLIRISKHYNHTISYLIPYDAMCSFLTHVATFIILFTICEMCIAYQSNTSNISVKTFLCKNYLVMTVAAAFATFYWTLLIIMERSIGIYKISIGTTLSMNFTRFYEGVLINSLCLYLYVILATNEMIERTA